MHSNEEQRKELDHLDLHVGQTEVILLMERILKLHSAYHLEQRVSGKTTMWCKSIKICAQYPNTAMDQKHEYIKDFNFELIFNLTMHVRRLAYVWQWLKAWHTQIKWYNFQTIYIYILYDIFCLSDPRFVALYFTLLFVFYDCSYLIFVCMAESQRPWLI